MLGQTIRKQTNKFEFQDEGNKKIYVKQYESECFKKIMDYSKVTYTDIKE
jgi:hypothetical protein